MTARVQVKRGHPVSEADLLLASVRYVIPSDRVSTSHVEEGYLMRQRAPAPGHLLADQLRMFFQLPPVALKVAVLVL